MDVTFQIILHAGNARSLSMEAINFAKAGDFSQAQEKIAEAKEGLKEAHRVQTDLIQVEARGEKADIGVLLIHAQDHLMTAIVVKDMAVEFVALYEMLAT